MESLVISLLYPALQVQWSLSSTEEGLLASSVFAGLVVGNVFGGQLGDIIGRRLTLLTGTVIFLIAGVAAAVASDFKSLCSFRSVLGLAVGSKVRFQFVCVYAGFGRQDLVNFLHEHFSNPLAGNRAQ